MAGKVMKGNCVVQCNSAPGGCSNWIPYRIPGYIHICEGNYLEAINSWYAPYCAPTYTLCISQVE